VDQAGNPNEALSWNFTTVTMRPDRQTYKPNSTVYVTLYDSNRQGTSVSINVASRNYNSAPISVVLSGGSGVFTGKFRLSDSDGSSNDSTDILGVTAYYDEIVISYDVDDDGGDDLYASVFVDAEGPSVSNTNPADGAVDVPVSSQITLTFSEDIQEGSQFDLIEIVHDGGSVLGVTATISGNTLTLSHPELEYLKQYSVRLYYDSVRDLAGNPYDPGGDSLTFTTQAVPTRSLHVAPTGNDSTGDGTEASPFRTITRAIQAANSGDTIMVAAGTYQESVVVTKDVIITSVNGREATTIIAPTANDDAFIVQPASDSTGTRMISGFTISGAVHGVRISGMPAGLVFIENNLITSCYDGIYIENHTAGTIYIRKNVISNCMDNGIKLASSADAQWVEVKWNNLIDNGAGLTNLNSNQLRASLNFWGNPHGPSLDTTTYGDTVSGNVDVQPWLVHAFAGEEITTELAELPLNLTEAYFDREYFQPLPQQSNTGTVHWGLYSGSLPPGVEIVAGTIMYGKPTTAGNYSFTLEASDGVQALTQDASVTVTAYTGYGPAVLSRSPIPFDDTVSPDAAIKIIFDEAIHLAPNYAGYINIINESDLYDLPVKNVTVGTTNIANDTLIINHWNFWPDTNYRVSISNNVVLDADDNAYNTDWRFVTSSSTIPLEITSTILPNATVNVSYDTSLAATGGTGRYSWSQAGGSMIAGLTLNSNGTISGIPTVSGTNTFVVQVTDAAGASTTAELTLTVLAAPDGTPPSVVGKTPEDGAAGVSLNASVSIRFDESIAAGTNFGQISITPAGGSPMAVEPSVTGDTLSIAHPDFAGSTTYLVSIPAGSVTDMSGNALAADVSWSFTTLQPSDATPPVVTITSPQPSAVFRSRPDITGTITEDSLSMVEIAIRSLADERYWDDSSRSWVSSETWNKASYSGMAPEYQFQYVAPGPYQNAADGDYSASVRARDGAGNSSNIVSVTYRLDNTQPSVQSSTPSSGAYDVPIDTTIVVNFGEEVVVHNLQAIYLEDRNSGADVSSTYALNAQLDPNSGTLTITHDPLENGRSYALHLPDDVVRDLAGNPNDWTVIYFATTEAGSGSDTPLPGSEYNMSVIFEDADADGVYYYRPGGRSDTLTFSLSGLPSGLDLRARFGSLNSNGAFVATGAVYNGWITGVESGAYPGVYIFSTDITVDNANGYMPLAIELSGSSIPPFILMDTTTDPDVPRVALVNIFPPAPPDSSGLELTTDPSLDAVGNLHAVPGISFILQQTDGRKVSSLTIGNDSSPVDLLGMGRDGNLELASLWQAINIYAPAGGSLIEVTIDTEMVNSLRDKPASLTIYNISDQLNVQIPETNFAGSLQITLLDGNDQQIPDSSTYIDMASITYTSTSGEGYSDKLTIPLHRLSTYKIRISMIFPKGDVNHSGSVDLDDAITALQAVSGQNISTIYPDADVDGDGRIGLAEAIHGLQAAAALR